MVEDDNDCFETIEVDVESIHYVHQRKRDQLNGGGGVGGGGGGDGRGGGGSGGGGEA